MRSAARASKDSGIRSMTRVGYSELLTLFFNSLNLVKTFLQIKHKGGASKKQDLFDTRLA